MQSFYLINGFIEKYVRRFLLPLNFILFKIATKFSNVPSVRGLNLKLKT